MEALQQAIETISESNNPLIILPKQADFDQLGSAASLFYTLNKSGKLANYYPKNINQKYPFVFETKNLSKNLLISIKDQEVSGLRYEKEKRLLKIFLTIEDEKMDKKNIQIDALPNYKEETDLIITIGLQTLEQIGNFYEKNFKFFYETPVLNIDDQKTNTLFGTNNLVDDQKPISLTLKKLLKQGNYKLDNKINLWLLAGAISSLKEIPASKETFELMSLEIDYQRLLDLFFHEQNKKTKLLEEALKTIDFLEDKKLPIISLSWQKFKKANANVYDISYLLKKFTADPFYFSNLLLIWQGSQNSKIQGVLCSQKINQEFKEKFQARQKGNGLLFSLNASDIKEAKEKIIKTINYD